VQEGPKKKGASLESQLVEFGRFDARSVALLQALHLLTREGLLNQDARRKLKQVVHLVRFLEEELKDLMLSSPGGMGRIVDLGAGKSYLGLLLMDLALREHPEWSLLAVEQRSELVQSLRNIASQMGLGDRVEALDLSLQQLKSESLRERSGSEPVPIQKLIVLALHACDQATDWSLIHGVRARAECIALVPCCQAELAQQLSQSQLKSMTAKALQPLTGEGIHRREFGSHLTNVMRTLFLRAQGYRVRVTELVGWEHSMKNELILARRGAGENPQDHPAAVEARLALSELSREFGGVFPSVLNRLVQ
jgi:hypothetical protein